MVARRHAEAGVQQNIACVVHKRVSDLKTYNGCGDPSWKLLLPLFSFEHIAHIICGYPPCEEVQHSY